jgi:phenylpyruvate tautomerase PptA (4-oxalocrotonate tautomerase family)
MATSATLRRDEMDDEERDMPDVLIEVKGLWLGRQKSGLLDAVHAALVETLRIPPEDKLLRLIEHASGDFVIPRDMGERFTRIEITMFAGRSGQAKRALYKAIVRNLEPFGVPPQDVKVVLVEVPGENVGLRGGRAACDIDLGYEIKV